MSIREIDIKEEQYPEGLQDEDRDLHIKLRTEARKLHKNEDEYWRTHTKIRWQVESNRNNKFFHATVNAMHRKNMIDSQLYSGHIISNLEDIISLFKQHFFDIFNYSSS